MKGGNFMKKCVKNLLAVLLALCCSLAAFPIIGLAAFEEDFEVVGYYPVTSDFSEYGYADTKWVDENGNELDRSLSKIETDMFNSASVLPSSYNLADYGRVTSTKDQGAYGTCWAHSTMAVAESDLITDGLVDNTVDYSEDHLVYFMSKENPNGDWRYTGDINRIYFDVGATAQDACGTLASWSGVELESNAKYTTGLTKGYPESQRYSSYAHLQNWIELAPTNADTINNMNAIKQYIIEEGAVMCSFRTSGFGTTGASRYSQYENQALDINHAVTIIGWDDNYSVSNFSSSKRPPKNGAWLAKNSWGTSSQNVDSRGYFWISYYDATLKEISGFDFESADNYDNIYQHNYWTGRWSLSFTEAPPVTAANVFKAQGNELLKAISFQTLTNNFKYDVRVYTNVVDGKPESGTLRCTATGTKTYSGYHTISLPEMVELSEGQKYSVIVTVTALGSSVASVQFEGVDGSSCYKNDTVTKTRFSSNVNESYFKYGSTWYDTHTFKTSSGEVLNNAVIKAFTDDIVEVDAEIEASEHYIELNVGESATVDVKLTVNSCPKDLKLYWALVADDESIVSISETDLDSNNTSEVTITGLKEGDSRVYAVICDEAVETVYASDEILVTVTKPMPDVEITVSKSSITIYEGYSETVDVKFTENSCPPGIELKKNCRRADTSIVSTSYTGENGSYTFTINGDKAGSTKVRFCYEDKNTGEIYAYKDVAVTVLPKEPDVEVNVSETSITLYKDETASIDVKTIINSCPPDIELTNFYGVSDDDIISCSISKIDDSSFVFNLVALNEGSTVLRIGIRNVDTKEIYDYVDISITVLEEPEIDVNVTVSKESITLYEGGSEVIDVSYIVNSCPSDVELKKTYYMTDENIVNCEFLSGGPTTYPATITGLKPGTTRIKFYFRDKNTGTVYACKEVEVTVLALEKRVLSELIIESLPSSTDLVYKSDASLDGLKVVAVYSNGDRVDVTSEVNVSGFNTGSTGTKMATVEYEGVSATFEYSVDYAWWQWIIIILLFGWIWY